jgi:hypothetical protein
MREEESPELKQWYVAVVRMTVEKTGISNNFEETACKAKHALEVINTHHDPSLQSRYVLEDGKVSWSQGIDQFAD